MNPSVHARRGDFWTEAVRALGLQASGARSPFRDLAGREDALEMVRESATVLLLVGLVQIALSWAAGVGTAIDAVVYMPLALLLYRFHSRLAAALLLLFSLCAVGVTITAFVMGIEAGSDLVLIAVLLWASVRAVEATGKLRAEATATGGERPPIVLHARDAVKGARDHRRFTSSSAWLAFALLALAVAAAPRFLPSPAAPKAEPRRTTAAEPQAAAPAPAPAKPNSTTELVLPAPAGFVEPRADEPSIGTTAEAFVQPSMRLEALFVPPSELETFRRERRFAPGRYVMVQSVRQPRLAPIEPQAFAAAKSPPVSTRPERLTRLMGAEATFQQWLEAVARSAGTTTDVDGAKVRSEGVLAESPRVLSLGAVVEVPGAAGSAPTRRVVITSLVLARGSILVVYTHGTYAKAEDVAAAAVAAADVVRNVVDANPA